MNMNRCLILALYLAILGNTAIAWELNVPTRNAISLSGTWHTSRVKFDRQGLPDENMKWKDVVVPQALIPLLAGQKEIKEGDCTFWLERELEIPASWEGKFVRLEFEGISRWSKIYVNGKFAGEHFDTQSPCYLDIGKLLNYGKKNKLQVWVTNKQTSETASPKMGRISVGIVKPARVVCLPSVRVDDVFVMPSIRKKKLSAKITLHNNSPKSQKIILDGNVRNWEPQIDHSKLMHKDIALKFCEEKYELMSGETKVVEISRDWEKPHLWSPDDPHLYIFTATLQDQDKNTVLDVSHTRFGFREFWVDGTSLVLNGVKVFLPLLWGHYYGEALGDPSHPESVPMWRSYRRGFQIAKDSNIRAMRFPHNYGFQTLFPKALDEADEVGMLLLCYNTLFGFNHPYRSQERFWENSAEMVRRVIRRDRNHPSVIIWSLSNEWVQGASDWQYQTKKLFDMEQIAHEEDPTRPCLQSGSGALNGKGDIVSLHYPHEITYSGAFTELPDSAYWLESATDVRSIYLQYKEPVGNKPIAITENFHMFFPGTPNSLYFWLGENAYRWRYEGDYWPKAAGKQRDAAAIVAAGYRAAGVSALALTGDPQMFQGLKDGKWARAFAPVVANPREYDKRFYGGDTITRIFDVHNDLLENGTEIQFLWKEEFWQDHSIPKDSAGFHIYSELQRGEETFILNGGEKKQVKFSFTAPIRRSKGKCDWARPVDSSIYVQVWANGKLKFQEEHKMRIFARDSIPCVCLNTSVSLYDPSGQIQSAASEALNKLGIKHKVVKALSDIKYPATEILVIADNVLADCDIEKLRAVLGEYTKAGGWVICLEQKDFPAGWLPVRVQADFNEKSSQATMVQPINLSHPVVDGFSIDDFRWWRGDHYVTRCNLIKPVEGNFRPILAYGNKSTPQADRTPLLEILHGKGGYLLSQLLLIEKFNNEPNAALLLARLFNYARKMQKQKNKLTEKALGILLPKSEKKKDKWLKGLGARVKHLPHDFKAEDLNDYKIILLGVDKGFPAKQASQVLRNWVAKGGRLMVVGGRLETRSELETVFGTSVATKKFNRGRKDVIGDFKDGVFVDNNDSILWGISNADLCWQKCDVVPDEYPVLLGPDVDNLTYPPLLQKREIGRGIMLNCQLPLSRYADWRLSRRVASILLTNLGISLETDAQKRKIEKMSYIPIDIAQACNMAFRDETSGDGKGGWSDQGDNDLREFPVGQQEFRGIPFKVINPDHNRGKSCVALGSKKHLSNFPMESSQIKIPELMLDKIYFLHALAWTKSGRQAKYVVEYFDLATVEIPVETNRECRDWWDFPEDMVNGKVAWRGKNLHTDSVSVYMTEWTNPFPNRPIAGIKMVSDGLGIPILLGVTGAKKQASAIDTSDRTIHIDNSDLQKHDNTYRYQDSCIIMHENCEKKGFETPGGSNYRHFWNKLFSKENLRMRWSHNGKVSCLLAKDVNKPNTSFTMKYALPPKKKLIGGWIKCRFDAFNSTNLHTGATCSIAISNDNKNWQDIFKYRIDKKDKKWSNLFLPKRTKREKAWDYLQKYDLPEYVRGWDHLYVKCMVDRSGVSPEARGDIQMLRVDWSERVRYYAMELKLEDVAK